MKHTENKEENGFDYWAGFCREEKKGIKKDYFLVCDFCSFQDNEIKRDLFTYKNPKKEEGVVIYVR